MAAPLWAPPARPVNPDRSARRRRRGAGVGRTERDLQAVVAEHVVGGQVEGERVAGLGRQLVAQRGTALVVVRDGPGHPPGQPVQRVAARGLGPAKARVLLQMLIASGIANPAAMQAEFDRR